MQKAEHIPPREHQALQFIAMGFTSKEAAREMNCSPSNVEALISNAMQRFNARNRVNLVAEALRRGHLYLPILLLCFTTIFGLHGNARPVRRPVRPPVYARQINSRAYS